MKGYPRSKEIVKLNQGVHKAKAVQGCHNHPIYPAEQCNSAPLSFSPEIHKTKESKPTEDKCMRCNVVLDWREKYLCDVCHSDMCE